MSFTLRQWKRDELGVWQPFPPGPSDSIVPGTLDERHPHVGCAVCGLYAQVLPDGDDPGHWDDLSDDPSAPPLGNLSEVQLGIHRALSAWSLYHGETHTAKEHAAVAVEPVTEEKRL